MNALYRYIPSPLLKLLNTFNLPTNQHQKLICILHAIYVPPLYKNKRDEYMKDGFVEVNSSYLKSIDTNYLTHIKYLESHKIIEYISGKREKVVSKYRILPNWLDISEPLGCKIEINDIKLKKKLIKKYNQFNVIKKAIHIKTMESCFKKSFRIALDECIDIVDDWYKKMINSTSNTDEIVFYNNKYIAFMYPLIQMKDGFYYFKRNATNNRIDTNLTNLGKVFKEFLVDANELFQVDICNSQPFFMACIFKAVRDGNRNYTKYFKKDAIDSIKAINYFELRNFTEEVAQGKFYEFLQMLGKIKTRDSAKEIAYTVMFSRNETCENYKKRFKKAFPTIFNAIEILKNNNINLPVNKEGHSRFSILLQRIEAKLVIDLICRKITELGYKVYTIHDSVIFDKQHIIEVESIIKSAFISEFGLYPATKNDMFGNKKHLLAEKLFDIKYTEGKVKKMLNLNGFETLNMNGVYHVTTNNGIFKVTENMALQFPNERNYNRYHLGGIKKILTNANEIPNDIYTESIEFINGLTYSKAI